jgi:hypothetical protein
MMINLERSSMHEKYVESQKRVRGKYRKETERYFLFSPKIAGLNHGPLLMLENASVQKFLLRELSMKTVGSIAKGRLRELLDIRERLVQVLFELSHIKIPEIGLLGQTIQHAMRVPESIEETEKALESVERALTIKLTII